MLIASETLADDKYDGGMSEPALAPRNAFHGVIAVWVVSLLIAVTLGILIPEPDRMIWLLVSFGALVLLSFAVQLAYGRAQGFIVRVAGSVTGSLVVMALVSAVFGLAALVAAL